MNFKLSRICPFYDPNTPQWSWCGRPCSCRAFIVDKEARDKAIYGNIAKAPTYAHNIMPGDTQPDWKPFEGYGDFKPWPWASEPGHKEKQAKAEAARKDDRVQPDPIQMAQARAIAARLPNTGFGAKAITHQPRKVDTEDKPVDTKPVHKPPDVDKPKSTKDRKAYKREWMRKQRQAKKSPKS